MVSQARIVIDDGSLPNGVLVIGQNNYLSKKVSIFLLELQSKYASNQVKFSRKVINIHIVIFATYNSDFEDIRHVLIFCKEAIEIQKFLSKCCDISIPIFQGVKYVILWLESIQLSNMKLVTLEAFVMMIQWLVWHVQNRTLFSG